MIMQRLLWTRWLSLTFPLQVVELFPFKVLLLELKALLLLLGDVIDGTGSHTFNCVDLETMHWIHLVIPCLSDHPASPAVRLDWSPAS